VVNVNGTGEHGEVLREEVAAVLTSPGLRLSEAKTGTVSIEEGFDLLSFRIQRPPERGFGCPTVYAYPSMKVLLSITNMLLAISRQDLNEPLAGLATPARAGAAGLGALLRHGRPKPLSSICATARSDG
jgi:hypothetical protein